MTQVSVWPTPQDIENRLHQIHLALMESVPMGVKMLRQLADDLATLHGEEKVVDEEVLATPTMIDSVLKRYRGSVISFYRPSEVTLGQGLREVRLIVRETRRGS